MTRIPATRAYLRLLGVSTTNQTILDTMNQGALVGSYLGHGNLHNWAAEDIFLDSVDVPQLTNADRPLFLATLNCINGLHTGPREPNVSSLAEQILLSPTGGSIGVWSPSALASLIDYQEMAGILFRHLFTDRVQTLGLAATATKIEAFVSEGVAAENLEAMTYFGDPTVVLRVDGDRDGLTDAEEDACACALQARDADSDDDGLLVRRPASFFRTSIRSPRRRRPPGTMTGVGPRTGRRIGTPMAPCRPVRPIRTILPTIRPVAPRRCRSCRTSCLPPAAPTCNCRGTESRRRIPAFSTGCWRPTPARLR
jgi:hypothetical protein